MKMTAKQRGRKLRLQCTDGGSHDISFEVAMMSPRLWHIVQEISDDFRDAKEIPDVIGVCIGDLPSDGVKYALEYCRCVYRQQQGDASALKKWNEKLSHFDSRLLCELASASYHFDIQPLVDITCRMIANIMSSSDSPNDLRETFGLDDCSDAECNCVVTELRATLAGFDLDMLGHLGNHSDEEGDEEDDEEDDEDDEDERITYLDDEPYEAANEISVDDLLRYINGPSKTLDHGSQKSNHGPAPAPSSSSSISTMPDNVATVKPTKKKKKKKSKKKKNTKMEEPSSEPITFEPCQNASPRTSRNPSSSSTAADLAESEKDFTEKLRLAKLNPSMVFDESQFEDDDSEEVESFRQALEDAHKMTSTSERKKIALPVPFAPSSLDTSSP